MRIQFAKMVAAGNDFIVIEDGEERLRAHGSQLARRLCRRRLAIGADGVLLVESLAPNELRLTYHNADGSAADLCANGTRCAAAFAFAKGLADRRMLLQTCSGSLGAEVLDAGVRLEMPAPRGPGLEQILLADRHELRCWAVDTGVPHVVVLMAHADEYRLRRLGPELRFHSRWQPAGTNVDLAWRSDSGLRMRSWERGIEGETLACGTGAVAVALAAALEGWTERPAEIYNRLNHKLVVDFRRDPKGFSGVTLMGPVETLFTGALDLPPGWHLESGDS